MRYAISATSFAFVLGLGALLAQPAFAGGGTPPTPGSYTGDFNGDGRTDVLVADYVTGAVYVYVTAAGIPTTANVDEAQSALLTMLPEGALVRGVGDFNGDTYADILVQAPDGLGGYALAVLVSEAAASPVALDATKTGWIGTPPSEYVVAGVGDANYDGLADVYVINTGSADAASGLGVVYTYITSLLVPGSLDKPRGDNAASGAPIQLPVDWVVSTVGDLDGDGRSDFVGQAPSDGSFSTLYNFITATAGGITVNAGASGSPGGVPDGYGCCAAGDTTPATASNDIGILDETGSNPGLTYIFVTNADGISFDGGASTSGVVLPSGFTLNGFADFNNDGIADTLAVDANNYGSLGASHPLYVYLNDAGAGTVSDSPYLTSLPESWRTASFSGMSAADVSSGSSASAGSCNYNNPLSVASECKEYSGSGWTAASAQASCEAGIPPAADPGTWSASADCTLSPNLGTCSVPDSLGLDMEYALVLGGSDPAACGQTNTTCIGPFVGGVFTPSSVCTP